MRNLSLENVTPALERIFEDTPDPRLKELMQALVRHLHAYARETRLTRDEWACAMDLLFRAGKISSERRNEFIMFSDTLGLSAVVDMMNGVVILAQAGLNDAKTRQQLDPAARQAYLELLKNSDVSKIDRGDTKSVRLVFEITPEFLEAASHASLAAPDSVPGKTAPGNAPLSKKGHI